MTDEIRANNNETEELSGEKLNEILRIRRDKLAALQAEGNDPFALTKYDVTHHSEEIRRDFESLEGKTVSIAGRMMSKRVMGKASFCHVQDLRICVKNMRMCALVRMVERKFLRAQSGKITGFHGFILCGSVSYYTS